MTFVHRCLAEEVPWRRVSLWTRSSRRGDPAAFLPFARGRSPVAPSPRRGGSRAPVVTQDTRHVLPADVPRRLFPESQPRGGHDRVRPGGGGPPLGAGRVWARGGVGGQGESEDPRQVRGLAGAGPGPRDRILPFEMFAL